MQGTYMYYIFVQTKTESVMIAENVKSQMRKGLLEYCVLLLLRRETSYASDIITDLKEARLIVVEGTLYPLLSRLKRDGLLSYEWRESTQGPPRKYYLLTEAGLLFLEELEKAWDDISESIQQLRNTPQNTSL